MAGEAPIGRGDVVRGHRCSVVGADLGQGDTDELGELAEFDQAMTEAEGAVVGRALLTPTVDELSGRETETKARIGVTDLEDGAGQRLAFGADHFETAVGILRDPDDRNGAEADIEFDGDAGAAFAVVELRGGEGSACGR